MAFAALGGLALFAFCDAASAAGASARLREITAVVIKRFIIILLGFSFFGSFERGPHSTKGNRRAKAASDLRMRLRRNKMYNIAAPRSFEQPQKKVTRLWQHGCR